MVLDLIAIVDKILLHLVPTTLVIVGEQTMLRRNVGLSMRNLLGLIGLLLGTYAATKTLFISSI